MRKTVGLAMLFLVLCGGFFRSNVWAGNMESEIKKAFWDCYGWTFHPINQYGDCKGKSYETMFSQNDLGDKLEKHVWIPTKGILKVLDDYIELKFQFDDEAIDFFKGTFADSSNRMPIAFEIDISDESKTMDSLDQVVLPPFL